MENMEDKNLYLCPVDEEYYYDIDNIGKIICKYIKINNNSFGSGFTGYYYYKIKYLNGLDGEVRVSNVDNGFYKIITEEEVLMLKLVEGQNNDY